MKRTSSLPPVVINHILSFIKYPDAIWCIEFDNNDKFVVTMAANQAEVLSTFLKNHRPRHVHPFSISVAPEFVGKCVVYSGISYSRSVSGHYYSLFKQKIIEETILENGSVLYIDLVLSFLSDRAYLTSGVCFDLTDKIAYDVDSFSKNKDCLTLSNAVHLNDFKWESERYVRNLEDDWYADLEDDWYDDLEDMLIDTVLT